MHSWTDKFVLYEFKKPVFFILTLHHHATDCHAPLFTKIKNVHKKNKNYTLLMTVAVDVHPLKLAYFVFKFVL